MYNKHHECIECGAAYKIKHELEPEYYSVKHCPFCGAEDELEEEYDSFDDEDYE